MWGLVAALIGFAYGALVPGKQDKGALFRQGLTIGLVLGLVLVLLGVLAGAPAFGLSGFVGLVFEVVILTLLFILGVWVGDLVTARRKTA